MSDLGMADNEAKRPLKISAEVLEKISLSSKGRVKGEIRSTVGNPTPL
jgi:hypothetical protein